jgi:hypothetical protein
MKNLPIILILLLSISAHASDKSGNYAILGAGTSSCGSFVEARKNATATMYRTWLTGYFTALNLMSPDTYNLLGSTDIDGAILWVENYCRANPIKNFENAAQALWVELLPSRQKRAN